MGQLTEIGEETMILAILAKSGSTIVIQILAFTFISITDLAFQGIAYKSGESHDYRLKMRKGYFLTVFLLEYSYLLIVGNKELP